MKPPMVLRFLLVGLINSGVGYGVILLLQFVVSVDRRLANAGGYLVGGVVSYLLHRGYTFQSRRGHMRAAPRFVVAVVLCFALNLVVLEIGAALDLPGALAQAVAMLSYTVAFYLISRHHVFST